MSKPMATPAPDLDSLIAELQKLREEHGNLPTGIQVTTSFYGRPMVSVGRIASGPVKPLMRQVTVRGQPIVLITQP
jgi:hypothetical protein